ncbi:hypothetical protein COY62_02085 [bacterium (Candidatus Howlettbacteria) CG_4_10_14_0_8_um_filter_40_9]|nr:MAG: hypothetical protein COY62_02085 [bacterium (Candidatus Howlettbacteria) CG_4_10_14_0_8_um_filter_40_9]
MTKKEKFINTNELANKTSEIIRDLEKGTNYIVLRYSDPVGVLVSYEDYKKLQNLESEFVSECKKCLKEVKGKK